MVASPAAGPARHSLAARKVLSRRPLPSDIAARSLPSVLLRPDGHAIRTACPKPSRDHIFSGSQSVSCRRNQPTWRSRDAKFSCHSRRLSKSQPFSFWPDGVSSSPARSAGKTAVGGRQGRTRGAFLRSAPLLHCLSSCPSFPRAGLGGTVLRTPDPDARRSHCAGSGSRAIGSRSAGPIVRGKRTCPCRQTIRAYFLEPTKHTSSVIREGPLRGTQR